MRRPFSSLSPIRSTSVALPALWRPSLLPIPGLHDGTHERPARHGHGSGDQCVKIRVVIANKENRAPAYLAVNPRGRVPALRIADERVIEWEGIDLEKGT